VKTLLFAALLLVPAAAWAITRREGQGGEPAGAGAPYAPEYTGDDPLSDPSLLAPPSFLETIGLTFMAATRGERNNNPGNIRISSINWLGKTPGTDNAFETFATPAAGIRALAVNLRTYQNRYGLSTVRQIITRYAPASENNTGAYIAAVASAIGRSADDSLDLSDDSLLALLVAAIIKHENGRNVYSMAEISAAVSLA
jgi:hypothetical protein